jgi:hypothetical protein
MQNGLGEQMKIRLELRKGKAMVIKPKSDSNQPQVVVKLFLSKRTLPNVGCGFLEIYSVSRNSEDGRLTSEQTCARVRISEGSDVFDFWVTLIGLDNPSGQLDNPSDRVSQSGRVIWTGGGVIERIIRVDALIKRVIGA